MIVEAPVPYHEAGAAATVTRRASRKAYEVSKKAANTTAAAATVAADAARAAAAARAERLRAEERERVEAKATAKAAADVEEERRRRENTFARHARRGLRLRTIHAL